MTGIAGKVVNAVTAAPITQTSPTPRPPERGQTKLPSLLALNPGVAVDFGTCLNDKNPDRGALTGGRVKRRCPRLWSTHQSTP
jgi:hypothetical protein